MEHDLREDIRYRVDFYHLNDFLPEESEYIHEEDDNEENPSTPTIDDGDGENT